MDSKRRVQVVVELEQTDATVCGQTAADGGRACAFFGWLELIDHLSRAATELGAASQAAPPENEFGSPAMTKTKG